MNDTSLIEKLRLVEEILKKVTVPGFDIDVISSGVVSKFKISSDGRKIVVYLDFISSDPSCPFCKFINHILWTAIARKIRDALISSSLFSEVYVVDAVTKSSLI